MLASYLKWLKNGQLIEDDMRIILSIVVAVLLSTFACAETKSVHVFVALADNEHQGIAKVPELIGNGDDAKENLYWGALYGVKTFFKASKDWELKKTINDPSDEIIERIVFYNKKNDVWLVADAYRGLEIKKAVKDFLNAVAGNDSRELKLDDKTILINGGANLVAYIGHNGLMDFTLDVDSIKAGEKGREAIILCCKSKQYFQPWLKRLKAKGVLLTTELMAPEAYTIEAALGAWMSRKTGDEILEAAAQAYAKYQKCGINPARRTFYSEK
jgi:hypothetical protein